MSTCLPAKWGHVWEVGTFWTLFGDQDIALRFRLGSGGVVGRVGVGVELGNELCT